MGFSVGYAWSFYRPSCHHRSLYDLGAKSWDALDREPHVNIGYGHQPPNLEVK